MKITAIRWQKGGRSRVNVYFGETRLALSAEVVTAARLRVGDEVDEAGIEKLRADDGAWRCRDMALNLLSYRPRSRRELRDRLLRRAVPPDVVEACLSQLERAKLIDDASFGLAMAADRLRSRPVGRSRMIAELRAKGLDAEAAEHAAGRAYDEVGIAEADLARRAARKFRRKVGEDPHRARGRLYAFLARRGFSSEAAMQVLNDLPGGDGGLEEAP